MTQAISLTTGNKRIRFILLTTMLLSPCVLAVSAALPADIDAPQHDRMAWFTDARFGMFIHWGLYSIPAGQWKDETHHAEWIQMTARIPLAEYALFAQQFNPVKFDADQWVNIARDAGMKYLVITAKHHDGFALFDSPSNPYNISMTPFGRDPIRELADACRRHGLRFCVYYSLGRDWEDPDVPTGRAGSEKYPPGRRSNLIDYPDESIKDFSKYFQRKVKPQIRELLTQYGPIGVLWFDTPENIAPAQSRELRAMIRQLQPDCIVNSRIGHKCGDYETPEQKIPTGVLDGPWETCMTLNKHWGINKFDNDWKTPDTLIRNLVDIVSKGGNYLLNVGPTAEGVIGTESVERLAAIGKWLRTNGEAIYGAGPAPFDLKSGSGRDKDTKKQSSQWIATAKPGKAFIHVFGKPEGKLLLPALENRIAKAYLLADPSQTPLSTEQTDKGVFIQLPAPLPDSMATVVCLQLSETLAGPAASLDTRYLDPALSADRRTELLLSQMTLQEKIGQMCQYAGDPDGMKVAADDLAEGLKEQTLEKYKQGIKKKAKLIVEGKIGSFLKIPGAEAVNYLQSLAEQSRLKIPLLICDDAIHGHAGYLGPVTVYPTCIGMASSFDLTLPERIARATAREMRATGYHWTFSPNLDIVQDQRWGRTGETFGEDPLLVSRMSQAMVAGYQHQYPGPESVLACIKHLVGGGVAFSGINGSESFIPVRSLHAQHYPPYIDCIRAGARTLMVAHNALNGIPCHSHRDLLTGLLRQQWGFDGIVISDWHDVENLHKKLFTAASFKEACGQAVNAGIDIHMQGPGFFDHIEALVGEGVVTEQRIDQSVRRILKAKFELGLFENRYVDVSKIRDTVLCQPHRDLALEAARKSIVLLKNDGDLLPLKKEIKRLFVTGSLADNQCLLGDWALAQPDENVVTVLEGVRAVVSDRTDVDYYDCGRFNDITDAVIQQAREKAKQADYAVLVVGDNSLRWSDWKTSGENMDTTTMTLPGRQHDLIEAVHSTGTPTIVVLINSRPIALAWCKDNIPAIVEAWEPGMAGGRAVAEVLFGDVNPSGRLPITFPRSVGHLRVQYYRTPMRLARYADDSADPLFEFGHGLSYTRFAYSNLKVPASVRPGQSVRIEVDVTNAGDRPGDEAVLLFVNDVISSVTTPLKELKGFQRLSLDPGQTQTAVFELDPMQLSLVNAEMKRVVEPGRFDVMLGSETASFEILAD